MFHIIFVFQIIYMIRPIYTLILGTGLLVCSCVSQQKFQTTVDDKKRIELLLKEERAENDMLNTQRSIHESQMQSLTAENLKLKSDMQSNMDALKVQISKLNAEIARLETRNKNLEATLTQEKSNNEAAVRALGEKINDLAEDKQDLIVEKAQAKRKSYSRKKSSKKRRRR